MKGKFQKLTFVFIVYFLRIAFSPIILLQFFALKFLKFLDKKSIATIVTTGGTAGHVFPALRFCAYANKNGRKIYFVSNKIAYKIIAKLGIIQGNSFTYNEHIGENYQPHLIKFLPILPLKLRIKSLFFFKVSMINSWFFIILRGFFINKIIGFGGYASFPMLFWCAVFYKKIYIHEQNACVGAVNELFIPFATKIFTAFPIDTKIPNIHYSGMPLSHALEMQSAIRPNFSQQKINILIISGSSGGTESINSIVPAIILFAKRHKNLIHIYHQINESEAEVVRNKYHEHEISATVEPFFENIYELLPQINLCISRSGAGSIIDLLSFGITTIFVPLKNSARNHQMKNASWIVSNNIGFLYKPWESNVYNFAALISFAISSPQKIQHSLKAQGIIKKNARAVMYNSMWS